MCRPKNRVFSLIENLIIENYHDIKKVDSKSENFFYTVNFFGCDKNVTNPPLTFESVQQCRFHGMKMKTLC